MLAKNPNITEHQKKKKKKKKKKNKILAQTTRSVAWELIRFSGARLSYHTTTCQPDGQLS